MLLVGDLLEDDGQMLVCRTTSLNYGVVIVDMSQLVSECSLVVDWDVV